ERQLEDMQGACVLRSYVHSAASIANTLKLTHSGEDYQRPTRLLAGDSTLCCKHATRDRTVCERQPEGRLSTKRSAQSPVSDLNRGIHLDGRRLGGRDSRMPDIEILSSEPSFTTEDHRMLKHRLQFPYIAGPGVMNYDVKRVPGYAQNRETISRVGVAAQ